MALDLYELAREYRWKSVEPSADHLALLRRSEWSWDDCEFGAPAMDPKRPYGNSDVENDLAQILPHLSEEDRLRRHAELVGVLAWITHNYVGGAV